MRDGPWRRVKTVRLDRQEYPSSWQTRLGLSVQPAVAFVTDYEIDPSEWIGDNVTTSGSTEPITFIRINGTGDIPSDTGIEHNQSTLGTEISSPEIVARDDGTADVTLYTWSETHGIVTRWNVTVSADGSVQNATGTAVATGVGDYRDIPEGPTIVPEPGQVYVRE